MIRTCMIAIVGGALLSQFLGGLARWPITTLLMLWPSFGGHWVEVWFLNWLRPRLSTARSLQIASRVAVWFIGGTGLFVGMGLTARGLVAFRHVHWPVWWVGGLAFIGIELVAHLALQLQRRPSFYNGRG